MLNERKKDGFIPLTVNCKNCLQDTVATKWGGNCMWEYKTENRPWASKTCLFFFCSFLSKQPQEENYPSELTEDTAGTRGVTLHKERFQAWWLGEPPTHGTSGLRYSRKHLDVQPCRLRALVSGKEVNNTEDEPCRLPLCMAVNSWFSMFF